MSRSDILQTGSIPRFNSPKTGIDMNEPSNVRVIPSFSIRISADPSSPSFVISHAMTHSNKLSNSPCLLARALLRTLTLQFLATPYQSWPNERIIWPHRTPSTTPRVLCRARPPLYGKSSSYPTSKLIFFYIQTNIKHANGLLEYNTHNIFGMMMSAVTRKALLARRPGKRTFVITRSTFVGADAQVGKWLGGNLSIWDHYRLSIAGMLEFASIYQILMIGSGICGFGMFSFVCFILEVDKASSLIRWKRNREFVCSLGDVGRVLSFYA